ncbi:hypothetical protein CW354_13165 [Marinicaulis flavus]|uniref:Uncharacterized protein n=1 Tax=Hyphococcus luteus TaxID=2058213 RepID=A0A2S7K3D1_9PROT|nr:hypothetical protein CW354_13165 [Marinicaulis flavus]
MRPHRLVFVRTNLATARETISIRTAPARAAAQTAGSFHLDTEIIVKSPLAPQFAPRSDLIQID